MIVVLKQRWNGWRVGKRLDAPDGVANELLRRGVAVPAVEFAASAPQERSVSIRERAKSRR